MTFQYEPSLHGIKSVFMLLTFNAPLIASYAFFEPALYAEFQYQREIILKGLKFTQQKSKKIMVDSN